MNDALFNLPSLRELFDIVLRLGVAALLGGILGFEREQEGKAAGLRTHMLVGLASALFTVAPLAAGMSVADLSRVMQGVAAGIIGGAQRPLKPGGFESGHVLSKSLESINAA